MNHDKLRVLGGYTAGTAHKMNNLLGVISGNARYLLETLKEKSIGDLAEKDLKELRECLSIIVEKGDDVGEITKKLLKLI